jgi:acetolactate synthase I/III small subunit
MRTPAHDNVPGEPAPHDHAVLELTVNNHPGVMSHICGLFARRAFNLSGIMCMPLPGNRHSRMWLLIDDSEKVDQMLRQVAKLEDVLEVINRTPDKKAFQELEHLFVLGSLTAACG